MTPDGRLDRDVAKQLARKIADETGADPRTALAWLQQPSAVSSSVAYAFRAAARKLALDLPASHVAEPDQGAA